jgi:hypothetical protein
MTTTTTTPTGSPTSTFGLPRCMSKRHLGQSDNSGPQLKCARTVNDDNLDKRNTSNFGDGHVNNSDVDGVNNVLTDEEVKSIRKRAERMKRMAIILRDVEFLQQALFQEMESVATTTEDRGLDII